MLQPTYLLGQNLTPTIQNPEHIGWFRSAPVAIPGTLAISGRIEKHTTDGSMGLPSGSSLTHADGTMDVGDRAICVAGDSPIQAIW